MLLCTTLPMLCCRKNMFLKAGQVAATAAAAAITYALRSGN
jgi:hypothetical protein